MSSGDNNNKYVPPHLRGRGNHRDPNTLVVEEVGRQGGSEGGGVGRRRGRGRGSGEGHGESGGHSGGCRGDGTGGGSRIEGRQKGRSGQQQKAKVQIFDSFPAMHQQVQAARYKVHKPACECGKVRKSFEQPYMDGFMILPDTQNTRATNVYQYPIQGAGSSSSSSSSSSCYADNPKQAEMQLRNVLFPLPISDANKKMKQKETFKISCAACLLMDQPNGFIGIASDQRSIVEFVRDKARLEANHNHNQYNLRHYDHAIDVMVVPASQILALVAAKTRHQVHTAKTELISSLQKESTKLDIISDIKIGHHLQTMLRLVGDDDATFWFVMVQKNERDTTTTNNNNNSSDTSLVLDLPGGKRHLGESSLECAIRETHEETSLQITKEWMVKVLQDEKERENHFFRMQPPSMQLDVQTEGVIATLAKLKVDDVTSHHRS